MRRIFSAWADEGETFPHTLAAGDGPPRRGDGTADPDCQVRVWSVEVGSFEEACAIFDLRRGFPPTRPEGEAEPCPQCGAMFFPRGSGQCWNCDHDQ